MGNKKTKKIFYKIFVPVAFIFIVFAIISYVTNYISIDRFVKNDARDDIVEAFDDIRSQLDAFRDTGETDFSLEVSGNLIDRGNDTKVYVYNDNFEEVAIFDNSVYINSGMTAFLSTLLMNYELEEDVLTTISFDDREYLADTYVASSTLGIEEKYFVVIQDLTEKKAFMEEGLRSLILIQVALLLIAVIIVSKIAFDLSKPITNLAKDSNDYVVGKGVTISDKSLDIEEVEDLRVALYETQQNIDKEYNRKNTIYENVAHDLRTPLVSILGYADGLKSGIIKDTKKACDVIIKTGNQLKEMIENILMLSRFDNDTYKVSYADIDIDELMHEECDMIKMIDSDKTVEYVSHIGENSTFYTDRKLLVRLIQNLLSNAVKYAKSKVVVTTTIKSNDKEREEQTISHHGQNLIINVFDDGDGIEVEDLDNIFNRYYKGEDGHFGIGLAVVKNAVNMLGGSIKVKSTKGIGTTFFVNL
ncbi:MAG: HAMP domain-containing histidine kinase [Lachnospiraceae bacterium]|nr:HAMP domain-containing histidine kinase [Lachnospiraceae bacterium]